ncbi:MAG: YHS domain protein [Rhodobacteraceae bacterium]|nr:YHS domain protein [Paracoccaceae bacterium]
MITRRSTILSMFAILATPALAARPQIFTNADGAAAGGYDVTSYFTAGQPMPGQTGFSADWMGAIWLFTSSRNRNMFAASPKAYAPQYGGHCAYAASKNALASAVPEAWTIVDNKLYLNFNLGVRSRWRQNITGNIELADGFWPGLHG